MNKKKRVVVTGLGVVSCLGNDVDQFYQNLLEGKSGVCPIENFPVADYPTRFAGCIRDFDVGEYMDKKQARRVDPFIRYTIYAGKKALESGGLGGDKLNTLDKSKCGILIGSGMGGIESFYDGAQVIVDKGYKRLTPFFIPYIITNMGGALLAIDTGFMGPNYSVSTACATGNYAIYLAAEHIRKGTADLMLCGGAESAINPVGLSGFSTIKALSMRNEEPQKASRPFDKNRDGFVMGEGAGVLLLESLEHALARGAPILAEYLGGAFTCDAWHITDPHAEGTGVRLCIENALIDAGVEKSRINHINAHATSTIVGDRAEVKAIRETFGEQTPNIVVSATKSLVGHCLGAAAGIEAVVTVKAIQTGKIHPNLNLDEPEFDLNLPTTQTDLKVDVALSNSFGFGGHNSSVLFAAYKP